MAKGTWKMRYRVEVHAAVGPNDIAQGALLASINPTYANKMVFSQALAKAAGFVRQFQSASIDAEATVFGKPVGADATDPIDALDAGLKVEKVYASIDTPGRGLLQSISRANREPGADEEDAVDVDVAPDIAEPEGP